MLFPEMKIDSGAQFSPCKQYRYSLWRIWNPNLPLLGMVLLNPSTADAEADDPTIQRQGTRARSLGFGGLIVTNAFAYRSTDPEELYNTFDPIGPDNDGWIVQEAKRCKQLIVGWGKHASWMNRSRDVLELLHAAGVQPYALRANNDGSPEHPLYLPYHLKPFPYYFREANA